MSYGEKKIDGHWYYFHERSGVMRAGWVNHHNHTYYYNPDGTMYYGEKKENGHWYYFKDRTGVMATGLTKHTIILITIMPMVLCITARKR